MAFLNQAFASNPTAANQSALQWGAVGTGVQAGGQFSAGVSAAQMYGFKSALDTRNAAIATQNAHAALEGGDYEAQVSKLRYGELEAKQKVAAAASGVDASTGSAAAVRQSTETLSAMDAAMIHYNASRQAFGDEVQAASLKAQSKADQLAGIGAIAGGTLGAANTILGGASSLSQRMAQFRLQSNPAYSGGN